MPMAFGRYDDYFYAVVPAQNNDHKPGKGPGTGFPWDSFAFHSEYQQSLPQINSTNSDTICQVENIEKYRKIMRNQALGLIIYY